MQDDVPPAFNSPELEHLVRLCRALAGARWVQAGGGNVSVKSSDGRWMWIKASGLPLSEVDRAQGVVLTDCRALVDSLGHPGSAHSPAPDATYAAALVASVVGTTTRRPSMESGFHAVLHRVVAHTHPVYINALACSEDGAELARTLLGSDVVWVDYHMPGRKLSGAVQAALAAPSRAAERSATIVLASHGLIVSGDDPEAVLARTHATEAAVRQYFGELPDAPAVEPARTRELASLAASLNEAHSATLGRRRFHASRNDYLIGQAGNDRVWPDLGPLAPDDAVYGIHHCFTLEQAPLEDLLTRGLNAGVFLSKRTGPLILSESEAQATRMEAMLDAHVKIRSLIQRRGRPAVLADAHVAELLDLDTEKYRQTIGAR